MVHQRPFGGEPPFHIRMLTGPSACMLVKEQVKPCGYQMATTLCPTDHRGAGHLGASWITCSLAVTRQMDLAAMDSIILVKHSCHPMARCEPSAAGMGTTRMVARRERRENARNSGYTTTIPQTPVTPSTNSTTTTAAAVIHTSTNETSPQLQQLNLSDEELM
ncbi:unnamed protein product [Adineta ricciae]|uniref:Uncharacterized protein n=1 Tax=Adineta ricciae TaxID=249248 RepID=A0A816BP98_ADIRI|nr:unnamed protein product [Adineta ricciae]